MRKNGMSQHDNKLVKSVCKSMFLMNMNECDSIKLVSSISNIDTTYIKSLMRSYRSQK